MRRCIIAIAFLVGISSCNVLAQSSDKTLPSLRNVIPPSPNAASLGKYADWPVSLYTGLPGIDIPIYGVKDGSITVPISLNYHASGIKVGDVASWVGLGWSLDAGGVITRSVRGLADETPDLGYFDVREQYANPSDLFSSTGSSQVDTDNKMSSAENTLDTQPDMFMFNAMGKSFKLILYPNGTISTIPYSNVRVTPDWTAKTWTVIMEDGTTLLFGSAGFTELSSVQGMEGYVSSWYLKKVTSPNNDEVNFVYDLMVNTGLTSGFSEIDYKTRDPYPVDCSCSGAKNNTSSMSGQSVGMRYLTSIESDHVIIEFNVDPVSRLDLYNGKRLGTIVIKDKRTNLVTSLFRFKYSYSNATYSEHTYFSDDYTKYRLKLDGLEKLDANDVVYDRWSFEYNSEKLPERYSYAQDYWGYYNGQLGNETSFPLLLEYDQPIFPLPLYKSGNREPDSLKMQAEMLTKITFPTGGSTNFAFEANGYPVIAEAFEPEPLELSVMATYSNHSVFVAETNFVVTKPQYVALQLQGMFSQSYLGDHAGILASAALVNQTTQTSIGLVSVSSSETVSGTFFLTPGTYKYTIAIASQSANDFNDPNADARINSNFTYQKSLGNQKQKKMVGGVRIKSIGVEDNVSGVVNVRRFVYEDHFVISEVLNTSFLSSIEEEQMELSLPDLICEYRPGSTCYQPYRVRHSTTLEALGSIQGGTVGYGKVKTLYGSNGEGGFSISRFSHHADENSELSKIFPFPAACPLDWRRGLLLQQIDFNVQGDTIQKVTNTYDFEPKPTVIGYKAGYVRIKHQNATALNDLAVSEVRLLSELLKQTTKRIATYSLKNGSYDSLVVEETYFYDNPNNPKPVRTEFTNSSDKIIKKIRRTPLEKTSISSLSTDASNALDALLEKNILDVVLEEEEYVDDLLRYRQRTNYKVDNTNDLVLPENVFLKTGASPFEERVKFSSYDSRGNLREQNKTGDFPTSYLWGYNYSHPVAEIKNATYQNVVDAIGQTAIDLLNSNPGTDASVRALMEQLRQHSLMRKAQVTSFTHDPVLGVTSVTNPSGITTYYEYDAIGRLTLVRDHNNNIVKRYEYNFQVR